MKHKIKRIFIELLKPINKKLGYIDSSTIIKPKKIDTLNKNALLVNFYTIILESGFIPKHIVDVGANHGSWTREALNFFPNAYYSLFEPQFWLEDSIRDILDKNPNVIFNSFGLGNKKGSFKFTIANRDDSSSFKYTEQEAKTLGLNQIEVPVITLNDYFNEKGLPAPDIVKIDAEGLDLEVLEGASNFFGKTEIFFVEAAVVCNTTDNTVIKVINFMDEKGYYLFDITDINRPFKPKVLWLTELAFVKKEGILKNIRVNK